MNNIRNIDYGIQKIQEHFSRVFVDDFQLAHSAIDQKAFGNWIVVFQSKQCSIKFIQDRGSISVVIGPPWASTEPFDLDHFLDLRLLIDFSQGNQSIFTPPKENLYDVDKSLTDLSKLLIENFRDLVLLLNREDFLKLEREVKDFNLQRLRRMYPNIK